MRFSFHAKCALQPRVRTSGPADLRSNTAALDQDVSALREFLAAPKLSPFQVARRSVGERAIERIARCGPREAPVSDEARDSKRNSAKGTFDSSHHYVLPSNPRDTALAKEYAIERIARYGLRGTWF